MAVLLIVGLVTVALLQRAPQPTSVILVVLDTVRADHTTPYGYPKLTTPRLAEFAREGLLFERARAVAPWTLPSHASLFTGLLPSQHGCTWEHRWLVDRHVTLAETMRGAGFHTFGATTNPNASSLYHLDQGFETFVEAWQLRDRMRGRDDSTLVLEAFRGWLGQRDFREPFFAFVNFSDAHLPYAPAQPLDTMFGQPDARARELAARGDLLQATLAGEATVGPAEAAGLAALYDGDLRTVDGRFGALLDLLDEYSLHEDVVVIVTSDHGEHLGEEGAVDHQLSLAEELLHVPLVVRWPRELAPGRVGTPISHLAIADWIDALAQGRVPAWALAPDRLPAAFVAEQARPVDLVEFVRARGGDVAAIDRRLEAAVRFDGSAGLKLLRREATPLRWFTLPPEGGERPLAEPEAALGAGLAAALDTLVAAEPFLENAGDLVPAVPPGAEGLEELRRLGYAGGAARGATSVHAGEHWAASERAAARGELGLALLELRRATQLAPEEPALRAALAALEERIGAPR